MNSSARRKIFRWPPAAVGLYLIYHFPLALAYSGLAAIWTPLALLIPPLVLVAVFRRTQIRVDHPILSRLAAGLYHLWVVGFTAGVLLLTLLVDRWLLAGAVVLAGIGGWAFEKNQRQWVAYGSFAAAVALAVWREPLLAADAARLLFGAVFLGSIAWLFAAGEVHRVRRFDFTVLILLAPTIFVLTAFYRFPETSVKADPDVEFLYSAADPATLPPVRNGADLRFAVRDCAGELLLGSADQPGLERLAKPPLEVEHAPAGDNLLVSCTAEEALFYGLRNGEVVWRPAKGEPRRLMLPQPILKVQADPTTRRAFAMGRTDLLTVLRLPGLDPLVERRTGINIDLLFVPETHSLYRSSLFGGVEMLEPGTLAVRGRLALPISVGGTMVYDSDHERLFLSDWLGAVIRVLDPLDLTLVAKLTAPYGVRCLAYDRPRQLLLGGSYFTGEVWVYRPYAPGKPVRLPVGRRVRDLTIDGDHCLGVSAAGVFRLNLERITARISP